jgi:hypothetical protein
MGVAAYRSRRPASRLRSARHVASRVSTEHVPSEWLSKALTCRAHGTAATKLRTVQLLIANDVRGAVVHSGGDVDDSSHDEQGSRHCLAVSLRVARLHRGGRIEGQVSRGQVVSGRKWRITHSVRCFLMPRPASRDVATCDCLAAGWIRRLRGLLARKRWNFAQRWPFFACCVSCVS